MIIRQEYREDYDAIYTMVKKSFETAKVSDGTEQDFVLELRASANYIPALALVADDNGRIAGHIMLTRTKVTGPTQPFEALLLAPLAVELEARNKGLGALLVRTAMNKALQMGYKAVFLAGDPDYYRRFGFGPAHHYGIRSRLNLPEELIDCIMACELEAGALQGVSGIVDMGEKDEEYTFKGALS